jgi:outer membrane protein TolC
MKLRYWWLMGVAMLATDAMADVVNLEQAVDRALRHDARIREQDQLVEVARGLQKEAEDAGHLVYNTNLFVGLAPKTRGSLFETDPTAGSTNAGVKLRSDAFDIKAVAPWYNFEFAVIKPLATFGKIKHYTEAAQANVDVKKGDVALQRASIILDVHRAYYGYLTAQDTRLLMEDVKGRLEKAISLVQGWLDSGNGKTKQSDLFALQTAGALVNRYIAEAQGYEKIALEGLRTLTGVVPGKELELADKKLAPVELPKESLKDLQARALAQRPEMGQLDAGMSARRALVEAKKSESNPNLYTAVVGSIAYTPDRDRLNNPYLYDIFNHGAMTPIVGLKWDWDSGRQPARVAQAQSELNALVEKSSFARDGIPFQVSEQYQHVHAHHKMVDELTQSSRAGRRWMISSYADFEAGLEESSKAMTAFQGYIVAHSDYLRTVNDYNMYVAQLKFVTGDFK